MLATVARGSCSVRLSAATAQCMPGTSSPVHCSQAYQTIDAHVPVHRDPDDLDTTLVFGCTAAPATGVGVGMATGSWTGKPRAGPFGINALGVTFPHTSPLSALWMRSQVYIHGTYADITTIPPPPEQWEGHWYGMAFTSHRHDSTVLANQIARGEVHSLFSPRALGVPIPVPAPTLEEPSPKKRSTDT